MVSSTFNSTFGLAVFVAASPPSSARCARRATRRVCKSCSSLVSRLISWRAKNAFMLLLTLLLTNADVKTRDEENQIHECQPYPRKTDFGFSTGFFYPPPPCPPQEIPGFPDPMGWILGLVAPRPPWEKTSWKNKEVASTSGEKRLEEKRKLTRQRQIGGLALAPRQRFLFNVLKKRRS